MRVGWFYDATVDGSQSIVCVHRIRRVRDIAQRPESEFRVDVTVCTDHDYDARVDCAVVRVVPDVRPLPLHNIHYPVHVVPYCMRRRAGGASGGGAPAACSVNATTDPPHGFHPPCFALCGSHAVNDLYAVNPFFIK